eukprot:9385465-Pyramimonas_sp.AAC.1
MLPGHALGPGGHTQGTGRDGKRRHDPLQDPVCYEGLRTGASVAGFTALNIPSETSSSCKQRKQRHLAECLRYPSALQRKSV